MSIRTRIIISEAFILFSITAAPHLIYASSLPSGSNGNMNNYGNIVTASNSPANVLSNQYKNIPTHEATEQKVINPKLYEDYQNCYASLIYDDVGKTAEHVNARKSMIKKYCKAIVNVKYQKRFSDCFNARINSRNAIDAIIKECISEDDKPEK